jgi:hypothetical protein
VEEVAAATVAEVERVDAEPCHLRITVGHEPPALAAQAL